jgi:hypothetical protein
MSNYDTNNHVGSGGVARGCSRRHPLEEKNLWGGGGTGIKTNYSQDQRFSSVAGTRLRKFLATSLVVIMVEMTIYQL